jgi:hypothetical protein
VDIKAELFESGFEILADFLSENVGIGEVVELFEAFVDEQKMSRLALSRFVRNSKTRMSPFLPRAMVVL